MKNIDESVKHLLQQVKEAAIAAGRDPKEVTVIGVSKTIEENHVREAAAAGIANMGENYVQESLAKIQQLKNLPITWHFIGHLQRNKASHVARRFDWVHTVDNLPLAEKLSTARKNLPQLNICLQVNIDVDDNKHGLPREEALELAQAVVSLPHLTLRGLMTIPRQGTRNSEPYRELAALRGEIELRCGIKLDTLSMGMSGDFKQAIAAGATHIRVGTAIFGKREQKNT
ncbi:YggS family pyridoxal phosphate-dependent enzyme [Candidatus Persebacteraceae bacterium Df01]|jgi:pyridoxal phosphate enzyme (YggS family)|uniref:Pyridoxal phosphate homeostasis protein n=1 Tax=Candidatus Doriopsillibacter californiensis TaxID=2970740 RepID=A0ABT7QN12_9GAMM|nr:YggS family pyridoxal phosphate-dependent enzyme [Candidatus Persebacteraceae bacterium Df01]